MHSESYILLPRDLTEFVYSIYIQTRIAPAVFEFQNGTIPLKYTDYAVIMGRGDIVNQKVQVFSWWQSCPAFLCKLISP